MKKESIVKLFKQPSFILENIKYLRVQIKQLRKKFARLQHMQSLRIQEKFPIYYLRGRMNKVITKLKIQFLFRIILYR